jgi:hypothetical protein
MTVDSTILDAKIQGLARGGSYVFKVMTHIHCPPPFALVRPTPPTRTLFLGGVVVVGVSVCADHVLVGFEYRCRCYVSCACGSGVRGELCWGWRVRVLQASAGCKRCGVGPSEPLPPPSPGPPVLYPHHHVYRHAIVQSFSHQRPCMAYLLPPPSIPSTAHATILPTWTVLISLFVCWLATSHIQ